jgi:hypothetical protein
VRTSVEKVRAGPRAKAQRRKGPSKELLWGVRLNH